MTTLPPPSTASYIVATAIVGACAGYFLGQASSIGLFSSSTSPPNPKQPPHKTKSKKTSWPNSYDVTVHPDSSDEELMTHLQGGKTKTKPKPTQKKKKQQVKDSEDDDDDDSTSSTSSSATSDGNSQSSDPAQQPQPPSGLQTFPHNSDECKLVLVVRTDLGMGKGKIAAQCAHATLACYKQHLSSSPSSPLLRRWERAGSAKIALQVPTLSELESLRAKAVSVGLCAQVVHDAGRTQVASGSATVLGVGPGPRGVVDGVTGGLRLL